MPLPSKKLTLIGFAFLAAIFIYLNKTSDAPQDDKNVTRHTEENNNFSKSKINAAATDPYSPIEKTDKIPSPLEQSASPQNKIAETILEPAHPDQPGTNDEIKIDTALMPEPLQPEEQGSHWAFEKESYYINLFSEEESLSGFVLAETRCEDRQCKLSFLLEDEQQKDAITNKLMEKLMSQSEDLNVAFDLNTPRHEAVLYIKNGTIN